MWICTFQPLTSLSLLDELVPELKMTDTYTNLSQKNIK